MKHDAAKQEALYALHWLQVQRFCVSRVESSHHAANQRRTLYHVTVEVLYLTPSRRAVSGCMVCSVATVDHVIQLATSRDAIRDGRF